MIVIVDYGMGNIRSIERKLQKIGAKVIVSSELEFIKKSEKIILPGVGHFKKATENIRKLGLWDALNEEVIYKKKPILGICLGMQLFAKHSEEGNVEGFSWLDADVVRFNIIDKLRFKIPHIGWNQVIIKKESKLFKNVPDYSFFYFVHSYYMHCNNNGDVLAVSEYEQSFVSAVEKENIFGVQFHPEKSHDLGEIIFKNFMEI